VVAVDGDHDWRNLTLALGRPDLAERTDLRTATGRVDRRGEVNAAVQQWIADRDPAQAAGVLQAHGVPAAAAVHVGDLLGDPQLRHRRAFGELHQPGWEKPLTVDAGVALFEEIPAPTPRPAPRMAQHTRQLCATLLGLTDAEIDNLVNDGVLELAPESNR
jgi:crotonobetainyl-CoA:carnitine CoA-transferase CaiB-like acyl-CoA transferase